MLRSCAVAASFTLLAACQHESAPPAACAAPPRATVTDGMFDVGGGLSLHLHCMGSGEPVVIMDAGFGLSGTEWQHTQPEMAKVTRVCGYDRAGEGYSDTPPKPHSFPQIVAELHALLAKANLLPPYVLGGHSMGGFVVRLYASAYPGEVSGVVLLDAATENQERLTPFMPPEAQNNIEDPSSREGLTKAVLHDAMVQLQGANRSLGDKPLVVLTAGKEEWPPGASPENAAKMSQIWMENQVELTRWSSNSVQVVAPNSSHFMEGDVPELVIAAVRAAVEAARTHRPLDAPALRALPGK